MPVSNQYFKNDKAGMGYKLFVPENYEKSSNQTFPLILFLHGIRKRGSDLRLLDGYGLIDIAGKLGNFPYIVIAPQCPADTLWPENRNTVLDLLSQAMNDNRVDRERVYVTGFGMGGNGAWDLAACTEGLFAAVVPLAGWYETNAATPLRSIPIWTFHGEQDDTVPISQTEEMVEAIKAVGGVPQFTRYPGLNHAIMEETYTRSELYEWLEQNKRRMMVFLT